MKIILQKVSPIVFFIFCALMLALSLRGIKGNPTSESMNDSRWKDEGPIELSPERGRFALTMSIVEDKSFHYSLPIARFTLPDLGYSNGNYVSLFAPLLSFVIIPGYLIGKTAGLSQVGTFAMVSIFALLNAFLIRSIAIELKAHRIAAMIGAFTYLFATPGFTYAVSLYQHHLSTFLILLSIFVLLKYKNIISLPVVWFLFALSIPLDYPNVFLMLPIAIYALGRIIYTTEIEKHITLNIKPLYILTLVTMIFPLLFFFWFNNVSYGNPLQLSGTVSSVKIIDLGGKPIITNTNEIIVGKKQQNLDQNKKNAIEFFNPRNLLNGFYIQFVSPDRGIMSYTPVILFGIFGWFVMYKKKQKFAVLFAAIIGTDVLLYSMWYDPWGGWAFGSRYLIPSYALLSIMIAILLTKFRKDSILSPVFTIVLTYSLIINSLGAITSNRNPPQVEVLNLEKLSGKVQKYTYERNWDYLTSNNSKAFVWQAYAKYYVSAVQYYYLINGLLFMMGSALVLKLRFSKQ